MNDMLNYLLDDERISECMYGKGLVRNLGQVRGEASIAVPQLEPCECEITQFYFHGVLMDPTPGWSHDNVARIIEETDEFFAIYGVVRLNSESFVRSWLQHKATGQWVDPTMALSDPFAGPRHLDDYGYSFAQYAGVRSPLVYSDMTTIAENLDWLDWKKNEAQVTIKPLGEIELLATAAAGLGDNDECSWKHGESVLGALYEGRRWYQASDYNEPGFYAHPPEDRLALLEELTRLWEEVEAIVDEIGREALSYFYKDVSPWRRMTPEKSANYVESARCPSCPHDLLTDEELALGREAQAGNYVRTEPFVGVGRLQHLLDTFERCDD